MNDLMTKSFLDYVGLKKQATKDLEISEPDLEMGQLDPSNEQNLTKFFEVNVIKFEMEEIAYLLLELQDFNEGSKTTQSAKGLKGIRGGIDSYMITILRKARRIKSKLEALDKSNVANYSLSITCTEGSSPVDRTRIAVTNGLRAKLREIMHDFQALREKILQDHKDGLENRHCRGTGQEPSEEVVKTMILGDGQERVSEGKGDLVVENKERHEALKEVQKSLNELQRVFLDMAVLVETQGGDHGMNDIEENVALGKNYICGGTNGLYHAKQMKKRRDWCCWVGVFLLVLLVILVSILAS